MFTLFTQSHVLVSALVVVGITALARFILQTYRVRSRLRGTPGPPHSWIWGSLQAMGEGSKGLPPGIHPQFIFLNVQKKYNLGGIFYLDMWPLEHPMIHVDDPATSQLIAVELNARKSPTIDRFAEKLLGDRSMLVTAGHEWKQWRTIFNPGFSSQHLMSLVPTIVDVGIVFVDKLTKHAREGTVVRLEDAATRLTADIIGKVALDHDFNAQFEDNPCIEALRQQVHLLPNEGIQNPLVTYNPYRLYRTWRNHQTMINYIGKILDERFAAKARETATSKQRKKTILDLALDSYLAGEANETTDTSFSATPRLNAQFRKGLITQIRTFIFAGHDTTSSTICYALYLLHKNPSTLDAIRREHDAVLGPVANTADTIKSDPHLVNKLDYTTAVIKECLRLFPPASTVRFGSPDLFLRDPATGELHPTEGCIIWLQHYAVHRNPQVWGDDAAQFQPERFLPPRASSIPDGAFRPFEHGPRNCVGQNLAMLEARVVLALVVRSLDFELALDAAAELNKDGSLYAQTADDGNDGYEGEAMYQTLLGTSKPRQGMPMRVRLAETASTR